MILTIDIGNTRIKGALFEDTRLLETFVFEKEALEQNIEILTIKYKTLSHLVISSVSDEYKSILLDLKTKLAVHFISRDDPFPFQNLYATPQTLGIDRMVLAAGACFQFPRKNRLVIDAGTCVTYDFIDENDNYLGGAISPGLQLRYKSLHDFTSKLPLLSLSEPKETIGDSTATSIHSGVVNGLLFEIDGFINNYKNKHSNFIIILTGGDAVFLAKQLKNTIFANSNFLLESLNQTFLYKIKND